MHSYANSYKICSLIFFKITEALLNKSDSSTAKRGRLKNASNLLADKLIGNIYKGRQRKSFCFIQEVQTTSDRKVNCRISSRINHRPKT